MLYNFNHFGFFHLFTYWVNVSEKLLEPRHSRNDVKIECNEVEEPENNCLDILKDMQLNLYIIKKENAHIGCPTRHMKLSGKFTLNSKHFNALQSCNFLNKFLRKWTTKDRFRQTYMFDTIFGFSIKFPKRLRGFYSFHMWKT